MRFSQPGMVKKEDEIDYKELQAYKSSNKLVERYLSNLRQNGSIDHDQDSNGDLVVNVENQDTEFMTPRRESAIASD